MTDKIESLLTDYAMGELDDHSARKVEQFLAENPEAKKYVEKVRETVGMVTEFYEEEPVPKLGRNRRRKILDAPNEKHRKVHRLIMFASAASVLIIASVMVSLMFFPTVDEYACVKSASDSQQSPFGPDPRHYSISESKGGKATASTGHRDPNYRSRPLNRDVTPSPHRNTVEPPDRIDVSGIKGPEPSPPPRYHHAIPKPVKPMPFNPVPSTDRERYEFLNENIFLNPADRRYALSTFSIDVDTASYSNVRRLLNEGRLPPAGAVRIEEMINYFRYNYRGPGRGDPHPFAVHLAAARCPWNGNHHLVRIGIKGREHTEERRAPGNYVFLLDVSGSMNSPDKLPLLKQGMKMLVNRLGENDRVAIVTYAGSSGIHLRSTSCDSKETILRSLNSLRAGGSTNGEAGIQLAYSVASENFIRGGINRVILCTDGDFNVGTTSDSELVQLIERKARSGVFLTILGFGRGNYQEAKMEKLADRGNGNFGYIDSLTEARKILVDQMTSTLVTIAKDVKIQVEFNPTKVAAYRLIGYENRLLNKEDFNDDTKDAGEIGAGHTVTALYEVVPRGVRVPARVDPLRYRTVDQPAPGPEPLPATPHGNELLFVKLRYKQPDGKTSTLMQCPLRDDVVPMARADRDFRFAASVAAFGMILRNSRYVGNYTMDAVIESAAAARGHDLDGYRAGFSRMAGVARELLNNR